MKVDVLGTGLSWYERNNTSFVIDNKIILDMPEGSYKYVPKYASIDDANCIIITHMHSDHFLGINLFLTEVMRFARDRKEKLRVYGPKGLLSTVVKINKLANSAKDETSQKNYKKYIEFIDLYDGMKFKEGKYTITAYKMKHGAPDTFGFTFAEDTGLTVGFSADTSICRNLHKILNASKYAFVELSSEVPHSKHICIEEFEQLVNKYSNTKIYAVHTNDNTQKYAKENGLNALDDFQELYFG